MELTVYGLRIGDLLLTLGLIIKLLASNIIDILLNINKKLIFLRHSGKSRHKVGTHPESGHGRFWSQRLKALPQNDGLQT